jgi:hypothetical protein
MKEAAKQLLKIAKYMLSQERVAMSYQDIGHGAGSLIWWADNSGRVQTFRSTGREYHHELNKRMDMDKRWRGRLEQDTGTTTLLPPIGLYEADPEDIPFPQRLMSQLEHLGAKRFYLDTAYGGLKRVARRK